MSIKPALKQILLDHGWIEIHGLNGSSFEKNEFKVEIKEILGDIKVGRVADRGLQIVAPNGMISFLDVYELKSNAVLWSWLVTPSLPNTYNIQKLRNL